MMKKKDEEKRTSNEQPLKDLIDRWFKAYGYEKKLDVINVINVWPEIMGVDVANRTKDIQIKNKKLYLKIDSSVMREELVSSKRMIIERVNEFAKKELITDIWFY